MIDAMTFRWRTLPRGTICIIEVRTIADPESNLDWYALAEACDPFHWGSHGGGFYAWTLANEAQCQLVHQLFTGQPVPGVCVTERAHVQWVGEHECRVNVVPPPLPSR